MKLSEAAPKMNPGDKFKTDTTDTPIFKTEIGEYVWLFEDAKDTNAVTMSDGVLNLEGEIIRAEPEVLTAKENLEISHPQINEDIHHSDDVFQEGYISGHIDGTMNGQAKEYKRLKSSIDWAIFKNLTPPWKLEK